MKSQSQTTKQTHHLSNFSIVCPVCKGKLDTHDDAVVCETCKREYPIIHGIIDLRHPASPLLSVEETMLANFPHASFEELLALLLKDADLSAEIINDTLHYYQKQLDRAEKMTGMFLKKLGEDFADPGLNLALDLGCGSGAGVYALTQRFQRVVGIDTSMAQLLLAQKTLERLPSGNFILIRADANNLPFKNESMDYVQAINVLEHIMGEKQIILEISRCLNQQGGFAADSRNRFDIFTPEPHTGIRFLGFLPRRHIPRFVRWRTDAQYEQTWLLSHHDLSQLMRDNFRGDFKILFPDVSAYGSSQKISDLVRKLAQTPILRGLVLRLFPSHIVIGQKQGSSLD